MSETIICPRKQWPCRYRNAEQCAHDRAFGSKCPKVCDCECHHPAKELLVELDGEE